MARFGIRGRPSISQRLHSDVLTGPEPMLVIAGVILGVILGARTAIRRKGNRLDIIQFCAVYALAFGLAGLFLTLAAGWLGIGYVD